VGIGVNTVSRGRVASRLREGLSSRVVWILPFALVGAFYASTRLALLRRFPGFIDEAAYASWALRVHDSVNDRFVALAYGKLPLLSWLGAGLVFAGIGPLDAVRIVSILAGLGTMVIAALLAGRLGGRPAALTAAMFYAVLPLAFVHDVIGVMEPLVTALLAVALYLQVRLAERPQVVTGLLLGLTMGAALLTKETGMFALVLLPASLLAFDWKGDRLGRRLLSWIGCAGTSLALTAIVYLVLTLSELWDDYPRARESLGIVRSFGDGVAHPWRWIQETWPTYRPELVGYVTVPIALAVVVGVIFAFRRNVRLASIFLLWLLAPLFVDLIFLPGAFTRYLVPMSPLIALFAGYGVVRGGQVLAQATRRSHQTKWITAGVALVVVSTALVLDARVLANPSTAPYPGSSRGEYATGWGAGTGWPQLAAELRLRATNGPIVVASYAGQTEALPLLLRTDGRIQIVRGQPGQSGPEASADYIVENGTPLPPDAGVGTLRPVWTFHRPQAGTPIVLYRRGVVWQGTFYETPDALRRGLAVSDPAFDRFIAAHSRIRAWYVAESSR